MAWRASVLAGLVALSGFAQDLRNITTGRVIPAEGYADQPYVVVTRDGRWLCVLTTGRGAEGQSGQHIIATISRDQGRTWSRPVDIEPAGGPEASWAMPLVVPGGRVYVFYTYNADNLRRVPDAAPENVARRVDTLGRYVFKYSDDHGRTWSPRRYEIPMRLMEIDRQNNVAGKILFFWGVGKPIIHRNAAIFGFSKVGRWGMPGTLVRSEGCFLRSDNILTEQDPAKIRWGLLPEGDAGLRAPKGPVSEEVNLAALSDGGLYAVYRTIDGYLCQAYSRDHARTWTGPGYATYAPGGRRIKHPRAAGFVRRFSNRKYLLWFHNHGGEPVHAGRWDYYRDRNPGWIAGGIEKDGAIYWSQPEILLYDDEGNTRISYPDFIEDRGRFFITETQKTVAHVHQIDRTLLEGLWNQFTNRRVARDGLVLELSGAQVAPGATVQMPRLAAGRGFAIDLWVRFRELSPGQTILDARDEAGKGIALTTSDRFTLQITLRDGHTTASWDSDPGTHPGTLRVGVWQHVAVIVDGGPKIISFVVDGQFNDGGAVRQFGWGRFPKELTDVNGAPTAQIAPRLCGELKLLRIYNRYLRTSEVVGNYQGGY